MKALFLYLTIAVLGTTIESSYSFDKFYSKGTIISYSDNFSSNSNFILNNVEIEILRINNIDETLICIDVWQVFDGPINGGEFGRVCVVNGSFFCNNTYYRPIDRLGPGECHISVE